MTSDGNNLGNGTPAGGSQGGNPGGHPYLMNHGGYVGAGSASHNVAYADAGMASVVDQMSGLGIGSGHPSISGVPIIQHNGGFYYSPALWGHSVHTAGQVVTDANGAFWVQGDQRLPLSRAPQPYDIASIQHQFNNFPDAQRAQLYKFYERLQGVGGEVPALENRRSSYSTNESAPATPFYGSTASRDPGARVAIYDRSSSAYNTPSPPQVMASGLMPTEKGGFTPVPLLPAPVDRDLRQIIDRDPAIPMAVPAVFTPRENMKTVEQSLANNIPGNRNVYIRGLHPTTDDDLLLKYAERFGTVETSKAIIDTATGACKGFGFAKFKTMRDAEACIRGFHAMGYEVGFARVRSDPVTDTVSRFQEEQASVRANASASASASSDNEVIRHNPRSPCRNCTPRVVVVKQCDCECPYHTDRFTNFNAWDQESFNSRLKAEGDENNTNLYISNLPKNISETDLQTIFDQYTILSAKVLRDSLGNSRGVGFARFESREICDEIISNFVGTPLGDEGLPMQIRYSDTPAQKELKRVTTERRQFRTNEYNVGAYGTPLVGMPPPVYNHASFRPRTGMNGGMIGGSQTLPPRAASMAPAPPTAHIAPHGTAPGVVPGAAVYMPGAGRGQNGSHNGSHNGSQNGSQNSGQSERPSSDVANGDNPDSDNGSGDEATKAHIDSPLVANGSTRSSPLKKEKE